MLIGISADYKLIEPHGYHCVGDKYIRAVAEGAGGIPLLLPALPEHMDLDEVLVRLDGIVLPGAYSNIEPHHYRGPPPDPDSPLDPARDAVDLGIIPRALEIGLPLLAICRGFQAMNVAFGGSIHQRIHEVGPFIDHRENKSDPLEVQYGLAHPVTLTAGGMLAGLVEESEQMVNSVHGQGVDRLGEGLRVEAEAPDGLIEAFAVDGARSFALGVQWHPEWKFAEHPFYAAIWEAFRSACRERFERRRAPAALDQRRDEQNPDAAGQRLLASGVDG